MIYSVKINEFFFSRLILFTIHISAEILEILENFDSDEDITETEEDPEHRAVSVFITHHENGYGTD